MFKSSAFNLQLLNFQFTTPGYKHHQLLLCLSSCCLSHKSVRTTKHNNFPITCSMSKRNINFDSLNIDHVQHWYNGTITSRNAEMQKCRNAAVWIDPPSLATHREFTFIGSNNVADYQPIQDSLSVLLTPGKASWNYRHKTKQKYKHQPQTSHRP